MFKSIGNFLQGVFGVAKPQAQPEQQVPYKVEPPVQAVTEPVAEPVAKPVVEAKPVPRAPATKKKPVANTVQFPKEKIAKKPAKAPAEVKKPVKEKKSTVKAVPAIKVAKPRSTKSDK